MDHWNYSDDHPHGPSHWSKYYPATGQSQSPIDILIDDCPLQHQTRPKSTGGGGGTGCPCELSSHLNEKLKIAVGSRRVDKLKSTHRSHLDSVGDDEDGDDHEDQDDDEAEEEHQRSPSTSSADSSGSSQQDLVTTTTRTISSTSSCKATTNPLKPQQRQRQQQKTRYCLTNKRIFLGYPRYLNSIQLCNTGHAWQVNLPAELAHHTLLSGPPLADREYRLAQFHCHWGDDCSSGSEHRINGRGYAAEIHFVHWNCSQFRSMEEASKHKHGLAVLAVLVEAHDGHEQNKHKHLDKIVTGLGQIEQPDSSVNLSGARLDLKKLFPSNRCQYVTYEGSLTTPPLSEVVDWIVFLQPIQCSAQQIEQFRRISCPEGRLTKNCRPVQLVNERLVSVWSTTHHCKQ